MHNRVNVRNARGTAPDHSDLPLGKRSDVEYHCCSRSAPPVRHIIIIIIIIILQLLLFRRTAKTRDWLPPRDRSLTVRTRYIMRRYNDIII